MTPEKYKELSIKEFTQAAKIYDSGHAGIYEMCKDDYPPILEELAKEYDGKIDIYKVDTEKEQELAAVFGIRSIPTLLFCPTDGRPQVAQGAMSKADFEKAIDELLLKKQ